MSFSYCDISIKQLKVFRVNEERKSFELVQVCIYSLLLLQRKRTKIMELEFFFVNRITNNIYARRPLLLSSFVIQSLHRIKSLLFYYCVAITILFFIIEFLIFKNEKSTNLLFTLVGSTTFSFSQNEKQLIKQLSMI